MKRRNFISNSFKAGAALAIGGMGMPPSSYARIIGANDRVRVGVVGFSDRFRSSLFPSFMNHKDELNYDIVAVSDLWKLRREEAKDFFTSKMGHDVQAVRNNDELYRI
ncbi:MAG: gfo/Idh/MocA family oxidoreductase, partial [Sphingobacteriales bacterium]